ncbi:UNVERIFIED_CONTAM: hypothetical protein HDU68_006672 [Siphonaria sp. JEL0065]|nr:hypothetical protein HDU68_006672 [Siphonaria sp. JEL0065]
MLAAYHQMDIAHLLYPKLSKKRYHRAKNDYANFEGLLNHVKNQQEFLETELIAQRLKITRRKLLAYGFPQVDGVSLPTSDSDFCECEEEIGRTVELIYPDLFLNEALDSNIDLPDYEDGMLAVLGDEIGGIVL